MSDLHAHSTGHAADELDADEPHTPMWLPLVGGLLFLGLALFAVTRPGDETAKVSAEGTTAVAPSPAPEAAPARPDSNIRVQRVPEDAIERVQAQPSPGGMPPRPGVQAPARPMRPDMQPGGTAPRRVPPGTAPTQGTAQPQAPKRLAPPVVDEHGHAPH